MPTSIPLISKNDRALRRNYISTNSDPCRFRSCRRDLRHWCTADNRVRRFVSAFSPCGRARLDSGVIPQTLTETRGCSLPQCDLTREGLAPPARSLINRKRQLTKENEQPQRARP